MNAAAVPKSSICKTCGKYFYLDISFDQCFWCRASASAAHAALFGPEQIITAEKKPSEPDPADNWKPARDIA